MALNAFRLAGDMSHVLSIVILLLRLQVGKSAVGKSFEQAAAVSGPSMMLVGWRCVTGVHP